MGGAVGVESVIGKGSTFWFTVTLDMPAKTDLPARFSAGVHPRRVLVVDDNEWALAVSVNLLTQLGFDVSAVSTGTAAVSAIAEANTSGNPFEAVLLDQQMPGMGGLQAAKCIREQALSLRPRLALLTASRESVLDKTLPWGIDLILGKPLLLDDVRMALINLFSDDPQGQLADASTGVQLQMPAALSELRVLLAEDNPLNQQIATELLTGAGATVTTANDGKTAVELAQREHFDVILMDMQMPDISGLDVVRILKALPGWDGTPVVAMTAHAMEAERQRCLDAGMVDFITKPIDPTHLFDTLLKCAGGHAMRSHMESETVIPKQVSRQANIASHLSTDAEASLAKLMDLLRNDDPRSQTLFEEQAPLLADLMPEQFGVMRQAIENFALDKALEILQSAVMANSALGITHE